MSTDALKNAYRVSCDWTEACEIYFTKSNIAARRWFAEEHCDGELAGISCTRCPWADEYSPGPIPIKAYLDNDWWFECPHCFANVYEYDNGRAYEGVIWMFCNEKCRDDYHTKSEQEGE